MRTLLRELTIFAAFLLGATVFTFPLVLRLDRAVTDLADPLLDAWSLAWVAHQLPRDPFHLFDANRYFPELGTLTFNDPMIGLAILVSPIQIVFDHAVVTLNVAMLLSLALSGYGACRLGSWLTRSPLAGYVAGAVFAFNPFRLDHLSHLQLQTAGFIPLLYLCISRYLEGGQRRHAVGTAVFLWFVAASCAYYGIFTWTLLGVAIPYEIWRTGAWKRRRRLVGLAFALVVSGAAYLPLALPFMRLQREFGFRRPIERLQRFSARPGDYLRSGSHLHQWLGLKPDSPERTLFPGILAVGLGAVGILRTNRRTALYLLVGGTAALASLGPNYELYRLLYVFAPGVSGVRVPPRFAIYVLLAAAMLAGWGAANLLRRLKGRKACAVAAILVIFPLVESFGGPIPYARAPDVPQVYEWLARQPGSPASLELPAGRRANRDLHRNALYLYWSTYHFKPIANGYSALVPPVYGELGATMESFPDAAGVELLRRLGIRYVILHRDFYLRTRASEIESRADAQPGLEPVHRTENETVYEVTGLRR